MAVRPLYSWIVLAAAFVIITMSIGTLFTLGVFLVPIENALGWSRSSIGAISFLNWFVMGLGGLIAGYLSDRFGTRAVVLAGGAMLGLGLVLSSRITEPWHFYVTFGVLVGGGVSCFYVPLTVTAVKWFDDRRGMAAAIVSSGNGFGILVLSPLTRWLIDTFDWRTAFWMLGDLAWLVVIPAALLLQPAPVEARRVRELLARPGAATPSIANAGAAAVRAWPFWAIAVTHFACCAAHSGPIFHMVSHAIDHGVAAMTAAGILGASGLASIAGRVGTGIIADQYGTKRTLVAALVFQALMVSTYLFVQRTGGLWAMGVLFGVAYGSAMPLYALLVREYFGERVMGTVYGAVFLISCTGMGLGSWVGGAIHDAFGSYQGLFLFSFALGAAGIVTGLGLRPPVRVVARSA